VTAVLLALGASLAWGFGDFGGGVQARKLPVPFVLAVLQGVGLAVVAVLTVAFAGDAPSWRRLAYGAAAGVIGVVGLSFFYQGMAVGAMGVVTPIAATAVLVPVGVGLARGERPSGLQAIGAAIAVAGVVAASLEPEREELQRRGVAAGAGLAVVAAACFGGGLVGLKAAAVGGPLWATLSMRAAGAPIMIGATLLLRTRARPAPLQWAVLAFVGVADMGANVLFGAATNRGLLSVVSVLGSLYPVIVIALARVLLDERLSRLQLGGAGAALVGVALISAG
jgi:drug/metabolite transporter (DMT)-like permease